MRLLPLSLFALLACGSDASPGTTDPSEKPPTKPGDEGNQGDGGTPATGPASVTVSPSLVRVVRGQSAEATIAIERGGRGGAVSIEAVDLPAGVSVDAISLLDGSNDAKLTLRSTTDAAFGGPTPFRIRATVAAETVEASVKLVVAGTPGSADTTFGTDGVATFTPTASPSHRIFGMEVDAGGNVLVAGDGLNPQVAYLMRIAPNGGLDAGFANGGKIVGAVGSVFGSISLRPDGAFYAQHALAGPPQIRTLSRYLPTGQIDETFGTGGNVVVTEIGHVNVRPNGGVLFGSFGAWAYDESGVLDTGFGEAGRVPALLGDIVAFDAAGRFVTCSGVSEGFAITRHGADGKIDTTFGYLGTTRFLISTSPASVAFACRAVMIQADGKIVVAGGRWAPSNAGQYGVVARLLETGGVDAGFGEVGLRSFAPPSPSGIYGGVLQSDQKIVVLSLGAQPNSSAITRFGPDSTLDTSFGSNGTVMLEATGPDNYPRTFRADLIAGRVIVAHTLAGSPNIRIARYWL